MPGSIGEGAFIHERYFSIDLLRIDSLRFRFAPQKGLENTSQLTQAA